MKNLVKITLLAMCVLVLMLQLVPDEVQGLKKVLKKLKGLKKYKKYAWILATQKKKFYAIPFPLPLPVFVKRQQIYTHVPIIPRYVQQPQHSYGTPPVASGAEAHAVAAPSGTGAQASLYPQMSVAEMMSLDTGSAQSELGYASAADMGAYEHALGSAGAPKRHRRKHRQASYQQQMLGHAAMPSSAKYLQQIATALGKSYSGAGHREIINKLLSGQAKVLPPSSLLSTIKSQSMSAPSEHQGKDSNYETSDTQAAEKERGIRQSAAPASSEHSQASHSSGSTSKANGEQADTKPSASELYASLPKPLRARMKQLAMMQRQQQIALMPINRYAAFGMPPAQIAIAMAASQAQRARWLQAQELGAGGAMEQQDGQPSDETQEAQDSEQLATLANGKPVLLSKQQLARNRYLQNAGGLNPALAEQLILARQQELYRMALAAREQQETAAQMAESRAVLMRAQQLGLLPPPARVGVDQLRLLSQRQLQQ